MGRDTSSAQGLTTFSGKPPADKGMDPNRQQQQQQQWGSPQLHYGTQYYYPPGVQPDPQGYSYGTAYPGSYGPYASPHMAPQQGSGGYHSLPQPHMGRPTHIVGMTPPPLPPTNYGYQPGVTPPPGLGGESSEKPEPGVKHDKSKRFEGTVKMFHLDQGYGFINCPPIYAIYGRDVFLNREIQGCQRPSPGLTVSFFVDINARGEPQGRDLRHNGGDDETTTLHSADKVYRGTLRTYNSNLGYGFINSEELKELYDHDVFVHKNQYERVLPRLESGEQCQFKVVLNAKGQPQAQDLEAGGQRTTSGGGGFVLPPNGKTKWVGKMRLNTKGEGEQEYTFLECDEAVAVWGHLDIYAHKKECPEINSGFEYFEFDVVLHNGKPQARNMVGITKPTA